jgi:hypothetical protein
MKNQRLLDLEDLDTEYVEELEHSMSYCLSKKQ